MFEKIREYISHQLEIPVEQIQEDATLESLGIDSLDVVEMISDLETELGIELVLDDVGPDTTIGDLADVVESCLN